MIKRKIILASSVRENQPRWFIVNREWTSGQLEDLLTNQAFSPMHFNTQVTIPLCILAMVEEDD